VGTVAGGGLALDRIAERADAPAAADGLGSARRPHITTDPRTGEHSVTLPLPDPATVQRLAEGVTRLLARLAR
jgi:hypothetical protein